MMKFAITFRFKKLAFLFSDVSAEPQHINIFLKEKGKKESRFIREGFPKSKFVEKNTTCRVEIFFHTHRA